MKLPVLNYRKLIKVLKKIGFEEIRQTGSHLILADRKNKKIVSVPIHNNKDLKRGLLRNIIKQAGLKVEELVTILKK